MKERFPEAVSLSVTSDEETYYVKAVNAGEKEACFRPELLERPQKQEGLCLRMQSQDLEAVNELTFQGSPVYRVKPEEQPCSPKDGRLSCQLPPFSVSVYEVKKAQA